VSLCEAVYDGIAKVEDMTCHRITELKEAENCWEQGVIPLIIDPDAASIKEIKPAAVIDAIIAKRNLGTSRSMAEITIALGPGFTAGEDVDVVIETLRGKDLGKLIFSGQASDDTGVPGEIAGESSRRVVRAPVAGVVSHVRKIGDTVKQGEVILVIGREKSGDTQPACVEVRAPIGGVLRGLIREGFDVIDNMKIADIDPRADVDRQAISDKANRVGSAALEAFLLCSDKTATASPTEKGEGYDKNSS